MAEFFTDDEQHRRLVAGVSALLLIGAAVALLFVPWSVEWLTGIHQARELSTPDDLPPLTAKDATPFFRDRDELEVRVAEATTLRQFLDRNRLNRPYTRKQITDQLGSTSPDAQIAAGTVFHLRLTPVVADVPGAPPETPK